jgi:hypothetical protein
MTNETPGTPNNLWQSQKREHAIMPAEEIRIKAHIVHYKVRQNLVIALSLTILMLGFCAVTFANTRRTAARIVLVALMLAPIPIALRARHRLWPLHRLSSATGSGCLDFYRQELTSQHRSRTLMWQSLVAIVFFSFLTFRADFGNEGLARILFLVALAVILIVRRFQAFKLRQRLAQLDKFTNEQLE